MQFQLKTDVTLKFRTKPPVAYAMYQAVDNDLDQLECAKIISIRYLEHLCDQHKIETIQKLEGGSARGTSAYESGDGLQSVGPRRNGSGIRCNEIP